MREHRNWSAKSSLPARITRMQAVRRAASDLQRYGWPRFQMLCIVALTGLAGFFASVLLLDVGVEHMWQRYPLAVGIAYLVFLLELWCWMHWRDDSGVDFNFGSGRGDSGNSLQGGGGDFGGGGATGGWDASAEALPDSPDAGFEAVGGALDGVTSAVGDGIDDESGCLVVLVLLAVVAVVGGLLASAFYLVYGAPVLMAELLVDAALSYGLYRNLRRQERGYWLFTAVRRTGWTFLLVAGFASILGAVLASQVPGARTLGEVIQRAEAGVGKPAP